MKMVSEDLQKILIRKKVYHGSIGTFGTEKGISLF